MIANLEINGKVIKVDLSKPIDISIPLRAGSENVNAFYIPPVTMEPFKAGGFVGDVKQGGSCNVFTITFNPHGNGTHTETVGHISSEKISINQCLKIFFFETRLISVQPEAHGADLVISRNQLEALLNGHCPDALVIRTLPNDIRKINMQYSGMNPPFMEPNAASYLKQLNVKHVLLDVPSIDKEDDGGKLQAHHAFWGYPERPRRECTISELVFVPENVKDGFYLLNLQIASFENDASPSKPVLYSIL
jgi:kynurenine formamidase